MSLKVFATEFPPGVFVSGIPRDVEKMLWPPPQWHVHSAIAVTVSKQSNLCHMRSNLLEFRAMQDAVCTPRNYVIGL